MKYIFILFFLSVNFICFAQLVFTSSSSGIPSSSYVNGFTQLPNGNIYIILNSNSQSHLYKSTNNGFSWVNVSTTGLPGNNWANSLFVKDSTMFIGAGNNGSYLYRSIDYGYSWSPSNSGLPTSSYVNDFALFPNGDIYIILNSNSQSHLYKSTNNGFSWINVSTTGLPGNNWANSLFVKDSTLFIGAGNNGLYLYRSTDNGHNWSASNMGLPISSYVNAIASSQKGDIYIILNSSSQSHLFKSTNNGLSWSSVTETGLPGNNWANSLFIKENTMFIGSGNNGLYLYRSTLNTGINDETCLDSLLIFPNPSIGQINIIYSNQIDEIFVKNILGQLIYDIKPNSKNVIVNIEKSGIYFITMISDNKKLVKKIIKL